MHLKVINDWSKVELKETRFGNKIETLKATVIDAFGGKAYCFVVCKKPAVQVLKEFKAEMKETKEFKAWGIKMLNEGNYFKGMRVGTTLKFYLKEKFFPEITIWLKIHAKSYFCD